MSHETQHDRFDALTDEDVSAYLCDNPDFLLRHPDIIPHLLPPSADKGRGVVDLQHVMLNRLRRDLAELTNQQHELIATTRANINNQSRVHAAVVMMLDAQNFEHLIHIITQDLAVVLDIDLVSLVVERQGGTVVPLDPRDGLVLSERGAIDRWLGRRAVVLRGGVQGDDGIYGAAAPLVRSEALVRLTFGGAAPAGLLALASRDPNLFEPGQGTDLLHFLAQVVERCVRGWLDLPPGE